MYKYSPSTKGFYREDFHTNIPEDVIEVSEELHSEMLATGKSIEIVNEEVTLVDPPAISVEKLIATAERQTRNVAKSLGYSEEIQMLVFTASYLAVVPQEVQETLQGLDEVWSHYHQYKDSGATVPLTYSTTICPYSFNTLREATKE